MDPHSYYHQRHHHALLKMASKRTAARETSARLDEPTDGHQLTSTRHSNMSSVFSSCLLNPLALLTSLPLHRHKTSTPCLTADALSSLTDQAKSQLDAWREDSQSHKKLAVGVKIHRELPRRWRNSSMISRTVLRQIPRERDSVGA